MNELGTYIINGLSLGTIYALIAMGIVVIYKASEVVTFTHGSLLLLGAFVAAKVNNSMPFPVAVLAGIAAAGIAALLVERLIIVHMQGSPVISLSIATIGVDLLLLTALTQEIGSDVLNLGHPWGASTVGFGGINISTNRLIALLVAIVLIIGLLAIFRFSSWGVMLRAAAEDGEVASLMGINLAKVSATTWLVAGALAAVAGIFLVGSPTPGVAASLSTIALRAFPAAILGGLDSVGGALVGGLIIGLLESLVVGYQSELSFLGEGAGQVVPYAVMIIVLLVRPSGLFGSKELTRV